MGETVWAYRVGAFSPGNGWSQVVSLPMTGNLSYLLDELGTRGLQGQVERLAIVAHGDAPGIVNTDPRMDNDSIWRSAAVCGPISTLRDFLTPTAQVMLVSCIAGAGPDGTRLLCALSSFWPGRTVIGFITSGEFNPYYTTAGDIFDTGGAFTGGTVLSRLSRSALFALRMTPSRPTAKWARDGGVVRMPRRETIQ